MPVSKSCVRLVLREKYAILGRNDEKYGSILGADAMQTELQETRTKIAMEAAMQELLREKPLEQIRVRELADRCGIRRQSFYYHFNRNFV